MKLSLITKSVAALCTAAALTSTSHAAPITGDVSFGGAVILDNSSLSLATQVNSWIAALAFAPSGDFDTFINTADVVTLTAPWSFSSGLVSPFWSIQGFTFDLTSSSVVTQDANFLNVTGTGVITGNGFDPTPGTWSFSISDADGAPNSLGIFGFTSNSAASAVPDGGTTVALLGFSMLGLHGIRRKLMKA